MAKLLRNALNMPADEAAQRLIGAYLTRYIDGVASIVKIVETEAYDQTDAASHSFKGKTTRTKTMFGPAGKLYVYFTYGMHYCCNVVCGPEGEGSAVLIRAVEPLQGVDQLKKFRSANTDIKLTNGPAKLCQALNITKDLNGHDLETAPLTLTLRPPVPSKDIQITTRIGIKNARATPWRFYLKGNPYISTL